MAKGNRGKPPARGYAVGYGKPPAQTRFRAGQSGNPAGRRPGARNFKTDLLRTLGAPVKVKDGARTQTKSTQEGALMMLREKALRGDVRALDRLLELALRFNNDEGPTGPASPLSTDDHAMLAAYVAQAREPPPLETAKSSDDTPLEHGAKSPRKLFK